MSDAFLGSVVVIDCGSVLGTYQGLVSDVDKTAQTISITHVLHNCLQCSVPQVTIRYSAETVQSHVCFLQVRSLNTVEYCYLCVFMMYMYILFHVFLSNLQWFAVLS